MGKLSILALLLASNTNAEVNFKYGLGMFDKEMTSSSQVKIFSFNYKTELNKIFHQKYELGIWSDSRNNYKASSYVSWSPGLVVNPSDWFYIESFWGIGGISATDKNLSSNFQFFHDFGFGLRDKSGKSIGINYKHISNAGISTPNKGRDFIQIQLGIPFN